MKIELSKQELENPTPVDERDYEIAELNVRITQLEAQLKALRKEKDDVADYLETMTARCVEDTALIGVLKNQLKAGEQITDLLQESYNDIYQQLSETRKQLKTTKRDAILDAVDSIQFVEYGGGWDAILVDSLINYANTIGKNDNKL